MTNHVEAGSTTFHNIISIYIYIYLYHKLPQICQDLRALLKCNNASLSARHAAGDQTRAPLVPLAHLPRFDDGIWGWNSSHWNKHQVLLSILVHVYSTCDMELVLFSCVCHERNGATTHIMNIMTKFLVYSGNKGSPFFCMFSRFLFSTL